MSAPSTKVAPTAAVPPVGVKSTVSRPAARSTNAPLSCQNEVPSSLPTTVIILPVGSMVSEIMRTPRHERATYWSASTNTPITAPFTRQSAPMGASTAAVGALILSQRPPSAKVNAPVAWLHVAFTAANAPDGFKSTNNVPTVVSSVVRTVPLTRQNAAPSSLPTTARPPLLRLPMMRMPAHEPGRY